MTDAGWRTDPTGRFEQRWFDGRRWTKRIRVGDAEAIDTLSVSNDLQPPAERDGPAPSWQPDPEESGRERFFDGHGWTAATRNPDRSSRAPEAARWPVPRILVVGVVALGTLVLGVVLLLAVL